VAVTRTLLDRLSEADLLGYPIDFDFYDERERDSLTVLGDDLAAGRIELAVMWGIEFGWLQQRHPDIKPLMLTAASDVLRYNAQLIARSGEGIRDIRDLPNPARTVSFKAAPLMNGLFLAELEDENPTLSFQVIEERPNFREALNALLKGDADCIVCDTYALQVVERTQPGLRRSLEVIRNSSEFPDAVIVGVPANVDRLRPRLWEKLQDSMIAFSDTTEGQELSSYWRMKGFQRPNSEFLDNVSNAVKRYPKPPESTP
jgi:ABC-type phosphate/phosphonate transport system substrate-binding protein